MMCLCQVGISQGWLRGSQTPDHTWDYPFCSELNPNPLKEAGVNPETRVCCQQ